MQESSKDYLKKKTSWQGGTLGVEIPPNLCNDTIMGQMLTR